MRLIHITAVICLAFFGCSDEDQSNHRSTSETSTIDEAATAEFAFGSGGGSGSGLGTGSDKGKSCAEKKGTAQGVLVMGTCNLILDYLTARVPGSACNLLRSDQLETACEFVCGTQPFVDCDVLNTSWKEALCCESLVNFRGSCRNMADDLLEEKGGRVPETEFAGIHRGCIECCDKKHGVGSEAASKCKSRLTGCAGLN